MPRLPLLHRLMPQRSDPDAANGQNAAVTAPQPKPRRRPTPPAGELRRERRALLRLREERLRDLGGIALEMYRRDRFREDLVLERCAELIGLEARIHELEALLGNAKPLAGVPPSARCDCGAPLLWGSRFCANCGRPISAESRR
jgi:transposase